jgi:hypothetical protein
LGVLTLRPPALLATLLFALSVAPPVAAGKFAAQRYDDDFTDLRADDNFYAGIKHLELGSDSRYLSFGGDLRERFEFFSRSNIGPRAVDSDSFLLHRLLLHGDLQWDALRLFAQLGNHAEEGREPGPKPTDVDRADLQQLFIDYRFTLGEGALTLRSGRQEMAFGASRLITARDGPNIRAAFDGVRANIESSGWKVSAIAVRPVVIDKGAFDDSTDDTRALWGIYGTRKLRAEWLGDIYYLGVDNDVAAFESVRGAERRHTGGARLYGRAGNFDTDLELILQAGDIAGQSIRAFAFATDSGWTWSDAPWMPRLGLRTDIISGDRKADDDTLGTFNALYPNGSYFSEAGILAQANLLDFAATLTVKPSARTSMALAVNPLWRYSTEDAVYSLPLAPMVAGDSSSARYIGTQVQWLGSWQYNDFLALRLAVVRFEQGSFVERGGGSDLTYVQFATSIRF